MNSVTNKREQGELFHSAARWISIILHPFLITASTAFWIVYLDLRDPMKAVYWGGWFSFIVVLPAMSYLVLKLRRNEFSDPDVSVREERKPFYLFGGGCLFVYFLSIILFSGPKSLFLLTIAALLIVITFGIVTLYLTKISIHVGVTVGFAVATLYFSQMAPAVLFVASGAVSWSRLVLKRHTVTQIGLSWVLSSFWVVLLYQLWL